MACRDMDAPGRSQLAHGTTGHGRGGHTDVDHIPAPRTKASLR